MTHTVLLFSRSRFSAFLRGMRPNALFSFGSCHLSGADSTLGEPGVFPVGYWPSGPVGPVNGLAQPTKKLYFSTKKHQKAVFSPKKLNFSNRLWLFRAKIQLLVLCSAKIQLFSGLGQPTHRPTRPAAHLENSPNSLCIIYPC